MADTGLLTRAREALADRYSLDRELGTGGSATVFLARDLRYERAVAVKVLRPGLAAEVGAERFLREIRITASFSHPHILPLLDSGESDGLLYLVLPYAPSGSLRRRLSDGPLPPEEVLLMTRQIASALDYAHRRGVLHRDVKPENVLFSDGLALVADFGLARALEVEEDRNLTRTGVPVGTPGYMSPEQALGGAELDSRTDVYGLACVVYESLIGWPPRMWSTEESVRVGRLADAPAADRERLDLLPGRLEQVLALGLAIRPQDRYAEPGLLAAALVAALEPRARIDEEGVRRVLRRAAELEAAEPEPEGTLSIGSVERIAAEVDIPPEFVRAAARELAEEERPVAIRDRATPVAPRPEARPLQVGSTADRASEVYDRTKRRIVVDRDIPVRVREQDYPEVAGRIEGALGATGTATAAGGSLTWRSDAADGERRLAVRVSGEGNATRLQVTEQLDLEGAEFLAPLRGAALGGFVALVLAAGLWQLGPIVPLLLIGCAILGGILSVDRVYWQKARSRVPELDDLVDWLAGVLQELSEDD